MRRDTDVLQKGGGRAGEVEVGALYPGLEPPRESAPGTAPIELYADGPGIGQLYNQRPPTLSDTAAETQSQSQREIARLWVFPTRVNS